MSFGKDSKIVWFAAIGSPLRLFDRYFGKPRYYDPAMRLRRLNIHKELLKRGYNSQLVPDYSDTNILEEIGPIDVAVFAEFGPWEVELQTKLKNKGTKIIRDHCEAIFGLELEDVSFNLSDVITCCSTKLEEITKRHGFNHTTVIKDMYEEDTAMIPVNYNNKKKNLKAGYVGASYMYNYLEYELNPVIKRLGYDLIYITENKDIGPQYDFYIWPDMITACDIILCPQRGEAKSNVKVTAAMALGMPVIASKIQSYKEAITNRFNGMLCSGSGEWESALIEIGESTYRKKLGENAKNSVSEYSPYSITNKWIETFNNLCS